MAQKKNKDKMYVLQVIGFPTTCNMENCNSASSQCMLTLAPNKKSATKRGLEWCEQNSFMGGMEWHVQEVREIPFYEEFTTLKVI